MAGVVLDRCTCIRLRLKKEVASLRAHSSPEPSASLRDSEMDVASKAGEADGQEEEVGENPHSQGRAPGSR